MNIQIHNGMTFMSTTGIKVLGDFEDKFTPLVDLLVRESIQNSTDAQKPWSPTDSKVEVRYDLKNVDNSASNSLFEGINDELNKRFPKDETSQCLLIRDSGTYGLTGHLRKTDVPIADANEKKWGNLIKLVYEIREAQKNSGSGGCWGLGKTVYFRLGIGLVLFYSRVFNNGRYESRLAACMAEDETSADAMIPEYPDGSPELRRKSGIAWWGDLDGENKTKPITDETRILSIINTYGAKPYGPKETGTTVIIPYLNTNLLLDTTRYQALYDSDRFNTLQDLDTRIRKDRSWLKNLERFLKLTVQRWYYPRLNNDAYSTINCSRSLEVYINDRKLTYVDMMPVFKLQQALFNRAGLQGNLPQGYTDFITENQYYSSNSDSNVLFGVKAINLNKNVANRLVGHVAYARANSEIMEMLAPNYREDPAKCFDINLNGPSVVVAYSRKPGMIIWYDFDTKANSRTNLPLDDDNFILAHFALNSNAQMSSGEGSLEDYIRATEKSNHKSWESDQLKIVDSIIYHVDQKVAAAFTPIATDSKDPQNSGLSDILSTILPPKGYGTKSSKKEIGNVDPIGGNQSKIKLVIAKQGAIRYIPNEIVIPYTVVIKKQFNKAFNFNLSVGTESGTIELKDLLDNMQVANTPFEFIGANIQINNHLDFIDTDNDNFENDSVSIVMWGDGAYLNNVQIRKTTTEELSFTIELRIAYSKLDMIPVISIKE